MARKPDAESLLQAKSLRSSVRASHSRCMLPKETCIGFADLLTSFDSQVLLHQYGKSSYREHVGCDY